MELKPVLWFGDKELTICFLLSIIIIIIIFRR